MINRGGEKIAPREIDEALLEHPDVSQAAAFAVPHVRLGEDVGAAVVMKPGSGATERELRQHVAARLAPFKVPRVLRLVDEIPTGRDGKGPASAAGCGAGHPGRRDRRRPSTGSHRTDADRSRRSSPPCGATC